MIKNPFILEPYRSKEFFCDREKETEALITNIANGRNTALISPRRFGKTGLIFRVFDEIELRNLPIETLYVDISDTSSLSDFIRVLSDAVAAKMGKQQKIADFFKSLKSVRPLLSYDPVTASPQVSVTFIDDAQKQNTLNDILDYLENYQQKVVLAIDEFQQIREYGESNMEAVLRKHVQHLRNVRFIFCGSKKHVMTDMFSNAKKPFYESTSFLYLSKLSTPVYADFIKEMFRSFGKTITDDSITFILEWTKAHTFYTQRLCNEVFARSAETVEMNDVLKAAEYLIDSERERFQEIRRLVTPSQWKMLVALASEGSVSSITSSRFLSKYGITSGPTAIRNITSLIEKELVLATTDEDKTSYSVYNVFLSRYLEGKR